MRDSKITSSEVDGTILITIQGLVSEDFDASAVPVEQGSPERPIRVDLGGVLRFTSTGVREWIYFVRRIPPGGFVLEHCSAAFVRQMSMVFNLAPPSAVLSLALPWYCESCGRAEDVMVARDEARAAVAAGRPCAKCGSAMVFDELIDSYLGWIDKTVAGR